MILIFQALCLVLLLCALALHKGFAHGKLGTAASAGNADNGPPPHRGSGNGAAAPPRKVMFAGPSDEDPTAAPAAPISSSEGSDLDEEEEEEEEVPEAGGDAVDNQEEMNEEGGNDEVTRKEPSVETHDCYRLQVKKEIRSYLVQWVAEETENPQDLHEGAYDDDG
ncbi:hypothetical protein DUNSADRAFT_15124 [Dunaliella salina]|uniref:Encoded protein n=1 Tax=Dunaliella salina TaxID=3046 RepID=A0ABQ7H253_DUNSA|nr:hypothetical protein DUNSADRAFT_15124 [Dunaliella salina]|eukprot:KAF5840923.1 hypothetical protein DUNSADRAFT_15124 [Dunaliella salina]